MRFRVGGRAIDLTKDEVESAMRRVEPETFRKHLVEIGGVLFPPKQVLATVAGFDRQSFTTMEAQRVLTKLGFVCRRAGEPAGRQPWVVAEQDGGGDDGPPTLTATTSADTQGAHNMTVRGALIAGRVRVASALALGATSGPEPNEETLSWLLQSTCAWSSDRITVRSFSRHEESNYTGADWLWWWEGKPDEWFGCLVQAKRLFQRASGVTFDFDFQTRSSSANPNPPTQIERLLAASDALNVPAAYLLYRSPALGEPDRWSCPTIRPDWDTAAATFVAAAIVNEWLASSRPAELEAVRPIECLACEGLCGQDLARLAWYAKNLADPEIRRILTAPPATAARRAFRALFSEVVALRAAQFRGQAPSAADAMHSGFQLGEHFARGLREPPSYVTSILRGEPPEELASIQQVAGVVIVSDR